MTRTTFALLAAFLLLFPGLPRDARGEATLSIGDNAVRVNDQPSSVVYGNTAHVAWIGGDNAIGGFRLYYAAIDAAADFRNLALTTGGTFYVVPPTAVADNSTPAGDLFAEARHPTISLLGSDRVVILFQGKGTPSDAEWGLYRATFRVRPGRIDNTVSVTRVLGGPGEGSVTFPSGALAPDGTLRAAYAFLPAVPHPDGRNEVRYARLGAENGALLGDVELSSWNDAIGLGSRAVLPLPSVSVDSWDRAHVAWVSEDDTASLPRTSSVYYAMVAVTRGTDNVQIGATNVLARNRSWSAPRSLAYGPSTVFVTAADNGSFPFSGPMGLVYLNPEEAPKDGNPVNVSENWKFLRQPPGVAILPPPFDVLFPTVTVDLGGRLFVADSGSATSPLTYFVLSPLATGTAVYSTYPTVAGFGTPSRAGSLEGDRSSPGLAFWSDRALLFWSGLDNTDPSRRNLNVTTVGTTKQWVQVDQTGCSSTGGSSPADLAALGAAAFAPLLRLLRRGRRAEGSPG